MTKMYGKYSEEEVITALMKQIWNENKEKMTYEEAKKGFNLFNENVRNNNVAWLELNGYLKEKELSEKEEIEAYIKESKEEMLKQIDQFDIRELDRKRLLVLIDKTGEAGLIDDKEALKEILIEYTAILVDNM